MSNQDESQWDKTPGIFSWTELMTHDAASSASFYTELFGWTREPVEVEGVEYSMFKAGGRPVAGMVTLPAEAASVPVAWLGYVTVEDLDASVKKAAELGAEICKEITAISMGRFAIIRDPKGAMLGLWQFAR